MTAYGLSPGAAFVIYDMQGRVVQRGTAGDKGRFETRDLASGIYLLRASDAAGEPINIKFTK